MRFAWIAAMSLLLIGCGGNDHDPRLVGTWSNPRNASSSLIFQAGGSGEFRSSGSPKEFTWTTKEKSLTIDLTGDDSQSTESQYLYSISSNGVLDTNVQLFGYQNWNLRH